MSIEQQGKSVTLSAVWYLPAWSGRTHLSLGSFFPLLLIRSAAFGPPPCLTAASFVSRSATRVSIASDLALNSGDAVEMSEGSTDEW